MDFLRLAVAEGINLLCKILIVRFQSLKFLEYAGNILADGLCDSLRTDPSSRRECIGQTERERKRSVNSPSASVLVEPVIGQHGAEVNGEIEPIGEPQCIVDAEMTGDLILGRRIIRSSVSDSHIWGEIPESFIIRLSKEIAEIEHGVNLEIEVIELVIAIGIVGVKRRSLVVKSVVEEPGSDPRSKPFSDIDFEVRRNPLSEGDGLVTVSEINLRAGSHADEPVALRAGCHHAVLFLAVLHCLLGNCVDSGLRKRRKRQGRTQY